MSAGPQTIVQLENANTILNFLSDNVYMWKSYVYTNWVDETHFPHAYGSGLLIACADSRFKKSIYLWDNGDQSIGCAIANIYNIGNGWVFNWRSI